MGDDAQEMSCLASRHEKINGCDVKQLASEATMIGQRINDHSFEFQVQAEKLPFILVLHAVVAIAPITDDDDDVRGVIEHDTLELAASMTMAEIFVRATTSSCSSIDHHQEAVFELQKSLQLELKQFGRLIVSDASVYVKPQSVDVVAAEDDGSSVRRHTCKVVYGNDDTTDGQLKQQIKLLSTYSLKALWFAMPMFYASLTHHYSTSTAFGVEDTLFLAAIITDVALILLLPKWGNALVYISCLLLELATCLLILSFNEYYVFAILTALLLLFLVALLQPKLGHTVDRHLLPSFTKAQDMIGDDDEESPYVGHLLDLSQGIASFGGLFTAIAGRFMVGPVNVVGFFFFCAIALGLYLSMVVTVRAVTRPHAKCLAIVVMVLVVLTFIAACIPFVGHSGTKPPVVT